MESHLARVATVAKEVQGFYDRGERFRIYHGSTNSTRRAKWKRNQVVDTSGLTHVLKIDAKNLVAIVEPNVPFDKLVEASMKEGLIPPVVPEFPGITVGGSVVGSAGESSSFKYGLVDQNVEAVEVVLANGEIVNASSSENADLFEGIGSSFGTLGVLTALTLRLIPAKQYVAVTYHSTSSFAEAIEKLLNSAVDQNVDFVDGIVFKRDKAVIVTGKYTNDTTLGPVKRFSRAQDQWFYIHARRSFDLSKLATTDVVPLVDYLFRYERGGFWTGRFAFKYFKAPFDRFSRFLTNRFMHTRILYQALHESGLGETYIVQDLALPRDKAEVFLEYVFDDLDIHPLWICPLRKRPAAIMNPRRTDSRAHGESQEIEGSETSDDLVDKNYPEIINVGVWGAGPKDREKFIEANRQLETKVRDLGGIKWLYAQTFYTEDEFWALYDRPAYDALRTKYHAAGLPTVYDKVKLDVVAERKAREEATFGDKCKTKIKDIWPIRGVYGVWRTLISEEYLLERKKS